MRKTLIFIMLICCFFSTTIHVSAADINKTGSISPETYMAKGDGVTDDTYALQNTINAAGVNGIITFKPGSVYIIREELRPLAGQTWYGYGSTIKRGNEVKTTTDTPVTTSTSSTKITVKSVEGFRVGMKVTVATGRNNAEGCYKSHTITAINGNELTLSVNFTKDFPTGGTLVTNHGLITILSGTDRVKIYGLELDGNRINNDTYLNWQTQASILSGSNYSVFEDLYIHDSQSDGIEFGGIGTVVANNSILRSGGNAIHLSGATGTKITGNYLKDATLAITGSDNKSGPDHAEGVITFSSLISDTIISGNHLENGRSFIGGIGTSDNSDITISDNTMRTATYVALEINGNQTTAPYLKNITIKGNRIYDGIKVFISNNQLGGGISESSNRNIIISDNYLENTTISLTRAKQINVTGNIIDLADNKVLTGIEVWGSKDVIVSSNQIIGGRYGIYTSYDSKTPGTNKELLSRNIRMQDNDLRNQSDGGIFVSNLAGFTWINTRVSRNSVSVEPGIAIKNYVSISGAAGISINGNDIMQVGGSNGITTAGDTKISPYGIPGSMVYDNTIRTSVGVPSIKIYGGTSNIIAHHNSTVQPISNGQPDLNKVENNYIIY